MKYHTRYLHPATTPLWISGYMLEEILYIYQGTNPIYLYVCDIKLYSTCCRHCIKCLFRFLSLQTDAQAHMHKYKKISLYCVLVKVRIQKIEGLYLLLAVLQLWALSMWSSRNICFHRALEPRWWALPLLVPSFPLLLNSAGRRKKGKKKQ